MAAPSVYAAINAITAELASVGIPKARTNVEDGYQYRSIDDVLNRLAPLIAKHRLCVLPRVLERNVTERSAIGDELLIGVTVRSEFTLVSVDDGSSHTVESYGEALDGGDKATAKALSAAYKSAMVQTFCIPISGAEDPDAETKRLSSKTHVPEPIQGWEQWARDIADIVDVCESEQALDHVQDRNRKLLQAMSRERANEYTDLGEAFTARREALRARHTSTQAPSPLTRSKRTRKRQPVVAEVADA